MKASKKLSIPEILEAEKAGKNMIGASFHKKLSVSDVLANHNYTVIRKLGEGSYSKVYLVNSQKYNQLFAVKTADLRKAPHLKDSSVMCEIEMLMHLNHPNIIKLYEHFMEHNFLFIVLEYCPGGSLMDVVKTEKNVLGNFWYYARDVISALLFCHKKKIAHRDIKPENIFLDAYGRVTLADFGFACLQMNGLNVKDRCGSRMYTAPELFTKPNYDPFKADIWSLGITFFVMACGEYPFPIDNTNDLMNCLLNGVIDFPFNFNNKIKQIIMKMVQVKPEKRASLEEILVDINGIIANEKTLTNSSNPNFNVTSSKKLVQLAKNLSLPLSTTQLTNVPIPMRKVLEMSQNASRQNLIANLSSQSSDEQSEQSTNISLLDLKKTCSSPPLKNVHVNKFKVNVLSFKDNKGRCVSGMRRMSSHFKLIQPQTIH